MEKLAYSELPQGGFAGLLERRFVMDARVFRRSAKSLEANGIGNFVYLADANFKPFGETGMHPHKEVDVISVMVDGEVSHQGSLEHGGKLKTGDVQVQRAGGEGFSHNEVNPHSVPNHMIQLWVLPDNKGEPAGYKYYQPKSGKLSRVYGGTRDQSDTFHSKTSIYVGSAAPQQSFDYAGKAMAYLSKGQAIINDEKIEPRTLIKVNDGLRFTAISDSQLIIISE